MVALGGHLLAQEALDEVRVAVALLEGDEIVVTHGNGPQVGEELLRFPGQPIHEAVARTQADIGSPLARALRGVCVLTHVLVDADDPAFGEPTKPIGPWSEERLEGPTIFEEGRGWRRVVPSPKPREIAELEAIRALVERGTVVVCCGGGGIPVADGRGVDAVIDKDHASALLAVGLAADRLLVLTDVDAVYRDEAPVPDLTLDGADALLPELPAGSMRPKVEACAAFVRATGGQALITSGRALEAALGARAGTRVSRT